MVFVLLFFRGKLKKKKKSKLWGIQKNSATPMGGRNRKWVIFFRSTRGDSTRPKEEDLRSINDIKEFEERRDPPRNRKEEREK
jgi:hypothetical protein